MKSQIPNITGQVSLHNGTIFGASGAFKLSTNSGTSSASMNGDTNKKAHLFYIDASNMADSPYGDYTEVNPLYESCLFIIRY